MSKLISCHYGRLCSALAVSAMHRAAREGTVTLTGPFPTPSRDEHLPGAAFPSAPDVVKYEHHKWEELDKWLPTELKVADLAGLLRDVALYKAENCQSVSRRLL